MDVGDLPDDLADHVPLCQELWVEVPEILYNWVHKLQMHRTQLAL